ncbi:DedA family protein [Halopelagius longus]|uniref:DedA family protein n=1 Tax=Halopelagius longus TaxID=1236180 RepID=A0A1H1DQT3_9EURY|nr:DedA family protein [Halopelagius longus]RDI71425.1 DedA family protein [Halopelagius longus]SDQ78598.1 membrane protein DedA, SNARE-associated domain [Halopelagius longus]
MVDLTDVALRFVRLYGPLALLLFTFLETSMLFPFLPSEVVVPVAAALIITDPASFAVFVLAATVGGTAGAYVPFYVFRGDRVGGSDWIRDRVNVSEERIERGREWFRRWGRSSVLWGRFFPALRSVVSIPAGLAGMDPRQFGAFTAVGSVGFYAATGGVVYYGRQRSLFSAALAVTAERPVLVAGAILALLVVGAAVRNRFRGGGVLGRS